MIPCLRFYKQMERTLEKKLLEMQLPSLVDTAFFLIQQDLQEALLAGDVCSDPVSKSCEENLYLYNSSGKKFVIPYRYTTEIRKSTTGSSGGAKLFAVDVVLDIPKPFNEQVEAQRLLCVIY